jgi:flagellar motor switch protein FliM
MRRKRKNQKRQRKAKKDEDIPTEVLSQDEIDQLLTAIAAGDIEKEDFRPASDNQKIRIYDFKRPDKFSREQIRTMSILHETFARNITQVLTNKFKMPCHVHAASVDQLTYEEFIRSVPVPTAMAVVGVENGLSRQVVFEIDPVISFALINRAFGGNTDGYNNNHSRHELTRLEWIVMKDVINRMVDCMKQGWEPLVPDIKANLHRLDTSPQFIGAAHPSDMTVLITLEVRIGDVEGMMNIDYPCDCLLGVKDKLSAQFWYGGGKALIYNKKYKLTDRMSIPVEMVSEIFRRDYSLDTVLRWKEEELLLPLTPRDPNTAFLRIGKRRVFECAILEDDKWFFKKVLIKKIAENPQKTEGKMEMNVINPLVAESLSEAGITVSVELGRTVKTINEILKMGEGTIVELDRMAGEPVDIKANGVLIAKGEVVVIGENFGVRVVEIVKPMRPLAGYTSGEKETAHEQI